ERIASVARRAVAAGYQVTTHAIGDRAVRTVLDAYEDVAPEARLRAKQQPRLRIEHAQVVSPADRARFARLGVIASMQPPPAPSDARGATARLAPERIPGAYAWRTLPRAGAHLAFGSDFPVEAPSVRAGLYAAVTRRDAAGTLPQAFHPEEQLTFEEAVA